MCVCWGGCVYGWLHPPEQAAVSLPGSLSPQGPSHGSPHQVRRLVGGKVEEGGKGRGGAALLLSQQLACDTVWQLIPGAPAGLPPPGLKQ